MKCSVHTCLVFSGHVCEVQKGEMKILAGLSVVEDDVRELMCAHVFGFQWTCM